MSIRITPKKEDDIAFTRIVSQILNNSLSIHRSEEVYLIQIDRRFDYKWAGFSNKFMGAVGVWHLDELRIPPFAPEKVVEELYFRKIGSEYISEGAEPLHIQQLSEDNKYRKIKFRSNSATFLWFSGETKINSQASIMLYSVNEGTCNFWFSSFINNGSWQIRGTRNISKNEIQLLIDGQFAPSF